MENKRELVKKALDNGEVSRVPVGFWWHFISGDNLINAYDKDRVLKNIISEHKEMVDRFKPDFIKIMSDGFFAHPSLVEHNVSSIESVRRVKPMAKNHPWLLNQVALVKEICEYAYKDIMTFYNIFSPLQAIRLNIKYMGNDPNAFQNLMMDHPEDLIELTEIIASDYRLLADMLKKETNIDGIYYSVQNVQHPKADEAYHKKYVTPTELTLLEYLNSLWEYNILHICGYDHFKNNIKYYKNYPAKAYNWAIHTDKISLKEGKEIFDACVIGGFDNNKNTLLDSGEDRQVESFVKQIIAETGKKGVIIGADCTIPNDVSVDRINFVKKIASK